MDTLPDDKEPMYYDLQQLSFTPGMADEEYAWLDKALTLGHPEDWPEGIDYTDHAYCQVANLRLAHVTRATNHLTNEYHEYQQQYEVPRELERIESQLDVTHVAREMVEMQAISITGLLACANRYVYNWYGTEEELWT